MEISKPINVLFYGHVFLYDKGLKINLSGILSDIMYEYDSVNFVITKSTVGFGDICIDCISQLNHAFKEKKISLTFDNKKPSKYFDIIISYIYKDLDISAYKSLMRAKTRGVKIIDLTCEETADKIHNNVRFLSDRARYVFEQRNEGTTLLALSQELGLSTTRISTIDYGARLSLKKMLHVF